MRIRILLIAALTLLLPLVAEAQVILPSVPSIIPCPVAFIPCGSGGASGLSSYLWNSIFPAARILFIATAVLMFLQNGLKLLFDPESAETASSTKLGYGYGITACAIVGIATFIVDAVGQGAQSTLINDAPVNTAIGNIVFYMRILTATLMTLFLVVQGIRLIIKQGSEEEFTNAKTQFMHAIMGVAVILLANVLVAAFMPGSGSVGLAGQIVGIINFVLTFIGALAIATIIIAGMMLVISVDESLKERAKKTIQIAVVGLIIAFLSYILVRFFIDIGINA